MDIHSIVTALDARVPHAEKEYMGDDGFLHCGVCHARVQTRVSFMGDERTVRCICDCAKKELEAYKEKQRIEARERRRKICFSKPNMESWTFANDNREDEKLSDAMMRYATQFDDFAKEGRGLLLSGTVGTGKTYFAACIANQLIDDGYWVLMTKIVDFAKKLQSNFSEQKAMIDDLNRYKLLILDDLGTERNTEYMQEIVFNIVDARYESGLPFIVTTNLSLEEIKKPQDLTCSRIYDRILERCFPIEMNGTSKRRKAVKNSYAETKAKLGL